MGLTVLFDLDDTLLSNDIHAFLPAYLKALGNYLRSKYPAEVLVRELLAATGVMVANHDPRITLEEAFDSAFYPALGTTRAELDGEINRFYEEIFPGLRALTGPRPEAVELVKEILARGYQVVIATNPVFPRTAIAQRLRWAGLPQEEFPFALVTSYERMHFAKPNPVYYAEILSQLGWPDQPAVMVGNDLIADILPAAQLELPTYWLGGAENPTGLHEMAASGAMKDLLAWMDTIAAENPPYSPSRPEALTALLLAAPAALDTILTGMPDFCWNMPPAPKEWSVTEVVCHLRDVDREVNLPRLQKVLGEENPFLPGIDSDPWAVERNYALQNGREAFAKFTGARLDLLALLDGLDGTGWERSARHAIFGPTRITELASFIAIHDRTHIRQILSAVRA